MKKQKEKNQNGQKRDKRFEARVGRKCCISRGVARLDSEGMQAVGGRGRSHSTTVRCNGGSHSGGSHRVTSRDAARGADPGMRAAKSPEFKEGEQ